MARDAARFTWGGDNKARAGLPLGTRFTACTLTKLSKAG